MLTLKSLCGGNPLLLKDMEQQPLENVYLFLLMDQEENKYQERLAEIYKKKKG